MYISDLSLQNYVATNSSETSKFIDFETSGFLPARTNITSQNWYTAISLERRRLDVVCSDYTRRTVERVESVYEQISG